MCNLSYFSRTSHSLRSMRFHRAFGRFESPTDVRPKCEKCPARTDVKEPTEMLATQTRQADQTSQEHLSSQRILNVKLKC